jgi:hypothetical protein
MNKYDPNVMNHDIDYSVLTPADYLIIQQQIEERARANATTELNFHWLVNDSKYRNSVIRDFVIAKRRFVERSQQQLSASLSTTIGTQGGSATAPSSSDYEGNRRDQIAADYGVVMSQFQTRFRDPTCDNLKKSSSVERLNIYNARIGYLGMKTVDIKAISPDFLLEALLLYVLDDIEEKQRGSKGLAGLQFLERLGMDADISSYYRAHRKSNHGGASSALYAFNESECFSFRRDCMRSGLNTDVDAMDEADTRKAKNHPYQRSFYGHPGSRKENTCQDNV